MLKRVSTHDLDELDLILINKLEIDTRKSCVDLARELNMSRTTVRRRVQRLLKEKFIEYHAVISPIALKYETGVLFGINTSPGKADIVAEEMKSLKGVRNIVRTTGRYDIFIWAYFVDSEELLYFLSQRLGKVSDMINIEMSIEIRSIRHYWGDDLQSTVPDYGSSGQQKINYAIDKTDSLIIRELRLDPRATTIAISKKIGISQSSVQKRLQELLDNDIVRLRGIADQSALGYKIRALIFVKVKPSEIYSLAECILSLPAIKTASIVTGDFLLYLWGRFKDSDDLHEFLNGVLGVLPGVLSYETSIITKVVNRSWTSITKIY